MKLFLFLSNWKHSLEIELVTWKTRTLNNLDGKAEKSCFVGIVNKRKTHQGINKDFGGVFQAMQGYSNRQNPVNFDCFKSRKKVKKCILISFKGKKIYLKLFGLVN